MSNNKWNNETNQQAMDFLSCGPKDKKCKELMKHIEKGEHGYTLTNPTTGKITTGLTLNKAIQLYNRFNIADERVNAARIIKKSLMNHNKKFKRQTLKRMHLRNKLKGIPSIVIPSINSFLSKKQNNSNYHGKSYIKQFVKAKKTRKSANNNMYS
jgi:hypothetical protein